MTVRGPQNQSQFSLFGQGQLPGFQPLTQRFGSRTSQGSSNPFASSPLSNPGGGLDQFGLFQNDLGNTIRPNLLAPPLTAEGTGGRFLAMG